MANKKKGGHPSRSAKQGEIVGWLQGKRAKRNVLADKIIQHEIAATTEAEKNFRQTRFTQGDVLAPNEVNLDFSNVPAARDVLKAKQNLPWNYANQDANVPIQFSVPHVPDDELQRLAQAALGSSVDKAKNLLAELQREDLEGGFVTLADQIIHAYAKHPDKLVFNFNKGNKALRAFHFFVDWLRNARRFVLTPEFTAKAAELSLEPPTKLVELALIARAPGENVWIEWDEQVRLRTTGWDMRNFPPDIKADQYLWSGFAITVNEKGLHTLDEYGIHCERGDFIAQPIGMVFEPSGSRLPEVYAPNDMILKHLIEYKYMRDETVTGFCGLLNALGPSYVQHWRGTGPINWAESPNALALADLIARVSYRFNQSNRWQMLDEQTILAKMNESPARCDEFLRGTAGDYRFALAVLALMSSTYTVVDQVDRQSKNVGEPVRHQKGYLVHQRVHLKLPKNRPFKRIMEDLGRAVIAHRRRHGVLPHWCERQKTKNNGCVHQFQAPDPDHLICLLCGHLKWRRKSHERGDASLGYVVKDYVVSPNKTTTV